MSQHAWAVALPFCLIVALLVVTTWWSWRQNRKVARLRQRVESINQSGSGQAVLGQFEATATPRGGPRGTAKLGWGTLLAFPAWMAIPIATGASASVAMVFFGAFAIAMYAAAMAFYIWDKRGNVLICVDSEGLTVNLRKGNTYSLYDAALGSWVPTKLRRSRAGAATLGTALHLRSGSKTVVLGGRDHRTGAGVRLEAPPTERLDAWMWADDFDRLLALIGSRSRLDVRGPAPGEPIRCLLFTNPWLLTRRQRRRETQPVLELDVGSDQIRAVDPNRNAPVASAFLTQVSATPADCVVRMSGSWKVNFIEPALIISFPGMAPLTIGCHDETDPWGTWVWGTRQFPRRFAWSGDVPSERETDFVVSGADWLTLVEKFGLGQYLNDSAAQAGARARG